MPKIEAATVAEHHAMRKRQVVSAAAHLLVTGGAKAVTPAAVARETGLARTSVYQYASSSADLLGAASEQLFQLSRDRLYEALASAGPSPADRLERIVRTNLEVVAQGHAPESYPAISDLPEPYRGRLAELHGELVAPLRDAITETGVAEPDAVTSLVWGAIHGIEHLVTREVLSMDDAVATTTGFVRRAVGV